MTLSYRHYIVAFVSVILAASFFFSFDGEEGEVQKTDPQFQSGTELITGLTPASELRKSAKIIQVPSAAPVHGSKPYPRSYVLREVYVENIRETFDQRLLAAETGGAEEKYQLSRLLHNCSVTEGLESAAHFEEVNREMQLEEEYAEEIRSILDDCLYVMSSIPEDQPGLMHWSYDLTKEAAKEGSSSARLELLIDHLPKNEQNYVTTINVLKENIGTGSFETFYRAGEFTSKYYNSNYHTDEWLREKMKWNLLGCAHQPSCKVESMVNNLAIYTQPHLLTEAIGLANEINDDIAHKRAVEFVELEKDFNPITMEQPNYEF